MIAAPGMYRSGLWGRVYLKPIQVRIESNETASWHWHRPTERTFRRLRLVVEGPDTSWEVGADLLSNTWKSDGRMGRLDTEGLLSLVEPFSRQDRQSRNAALAAADLGAFLREIGPNKPVRWRDYEFTRNGEHLGRINTWSSGRNYGLFVVYLWLAGWAFFATVWRWVGFYRWLNPRTMFWLTLAFMTGLQGICLVLESVLPSGNVTEFVEGFWGAVVNFPAYATQGDRAAKSPEGWAYSEAAWAVLASMMAAVFGRRPERPSPSGVS